MRSSICGSVLAVVFISLSAMDSLAHPDPPAAVLANPHRLEILKSGCFKITEALRSSPVTPDQSEGLHLTYDCLIAAAVNEFRENIATEHFTAAQFEQRLRDLSQAEALLYVDLNTKHARCYPCGTMWGPIEAAAALDPVLRILDDIWEYYSYGP